MKIMPAAALSVALTAGLAACSEQYSSGPGGAIPGDRVEQIVTSELTLVWSDGSGAVELRSNFQPSFGSGFAPSWSPDGSRFVFSTERCETDWYSYNLCQNNLVIMNPETRQVTVPAGGINGIEPAWAPSGDRIAFVRSSDGKLVIMPVDGSAVQEIDLPSGVVNVSDPSWSPDGNRIVFGCRGICVIDRDGTGFVRLTDTGEYAAHAFPAWSPDGRTIAFTILYTAEGEIALMSTDGTALRRLTEGFAATWSRDGRTLGFVRDGNRGHFTINADGSDLTSVRYGFGGGAAWRP